MKNLKTINAEKLKDLDPSDGIVLDVRTHMEHNEKHLKIHHVHVPLDELQLPEFMVQHKLEKTAGVYILCRSGGRAQQAAQKFWDHGYENVFIVKGGLVACEDCGHPVKGSVVQQSGTGSVKFKGPISLERQVRIVAGAFVVVGSIFSLILNPYFALIPLFVGSGLIFAGVTDRCGMALMLTKAPWNKIKD